MSQKHITQHLEPTRRLRKNISKLTALSNRSGRMTTLFASRIVSANGVTGPFAASATTFAWQQVVKQEMLLQSDLIDNIPKAYVRGNKCGSLNQESTLGSLQNQML
jgi:hypothetical protein